MTDTIFLRPKGEKKGNRVLLGICMYEVIPATFMQEMINILNGELLEVITVDGVYLPQAHNQIVSRALERNSWDYLLWLETDNTFPPNLLDRVRTYTEPVVGGFYCRRKLPDVRPIVGDFDGDRANVKDFTDEKLLYMLDNPGLHKVEVLPMGCTAIRRDVLENWPEKYKPWFAAPFSADGRVTSDDVYFCYNLKRQGIDAFVDTTLLCGHMAHTPITADTFRLMAGRRKKAVEPVGA